MSDDERNLLLIVASTLTLLIAKFADDQPKHRKWARKICPELQALCQPIMAIMEAELELERQP